MNWPDLFGNNGHVPTGADKVRSYSSEYMELGRLGESIVLKFLQQRPQIIGVEDFRELKAVHEADVDFAIKTRDGRVTLAEVKTDSWLGQTGNVLCEVMRINHVCHPDTAGYLGWSFRSPARWLLFYAPFLHEIWQIKFDDFRAIIQRHTKQVREAVKIKIIPTDAGKTTFNILIPEKEFNGKFTKHSAKEFE